MSNENDYKIKLICSPHDGSRNDSFLKFKRDLGSGTSQRDTDCRVTAES